MYLAVTKGSKKVGGGSSLNDHARTALYTELRNTDEKLSP